MMFPTPGRMSWSSSTSHSCLSCSSIISITALLWLKVGEQMSRSFRLKCFWRHAVEGLYIRIHPKHIQILKYHFFMLNTDKTCVPSNEQYVAVLGETPSKNICACGFRMQGVASENICACGFRMQGVAHVHKYFILLIFSIHNYIWEHRLCILTLSLFYKQTRSLEKRRNLQCQNPSLHKNLKQEWQLTVWNIFFFFFFFCIVNVIDSSSTGKKNNTAQPKKMLFHFPSNFVIVFHHLTDDDDELMLNVLRCHLTY